MTVKYVVSFGSLVKLWSKFHREIDESVKASIKAEIEVMEKLVKEQGAESGIGK